MRSVRASLLEEFTLLEQLVSWTHQIESMDPIWVASPILQDLCLVLANLVLYHATNMEILIVSAYNLCIGPILGC